MSICHLSSIRFNYPYLCTYSGFLDMMVPSQHIAKAEWPAIGKCNWKPNLEMYVSSLTTSPTADDLLYWGQGSSPFQNVWLPLWRSGKESRWNTQWTGGLLWSLHMLSESWGEWRLHCPRASRAKRSLAGVRNWGSRQGAPTSYSMQVFSCSSWAFENEKGACGSNPWKIDF